MSIMVSYPEYSWGRSAKRPGKDRWSDIFNQSIYDKSQSVFYGIAGIQNGQFIGPTVARGFGLLWENDCVDQSR